MDDARVSGWDECLRAQGFRVTPQRHLVLQAVSTLQHATPEEIYGYIHERVGGLNLSTVYRTLEVLEKVGLITHTHIEHGSPTYHEVAQAVHVHLVCRICKNVDSIPAEAIAPLLEVLVDTRGFRADVGHLAIHGTCSACS
jgi:Fur family ferric uptake transcriptional regulator